MPFDSDIYRAWKSSDTSSIEKYISDVSISISPLTNGLVFSSLCHVDTGSGRRSEHCARLVHDILFGHGCQGSGRGYVGSVCFRRIDGPGVFRPVLV